MPANFYPGQTDYLRKLNDLALAHDIADIPANTAAAAASAAAAAQSATGARSDALNASASSASAAAAVASFDVRYLGAKAAAPSADNAGAALLNGALYWDTVLNGGCLRVYQNGRWADVPANTAEQVTVTPAGGIASRNVQAALVELDTRKAELSRLAKVATTGSKADVGLANVDNTTDLNKPVSSATLSALNMLDAKKVDAARVSNVDNTADIVKPVSVATYAVLNTKVNISDMNAALAGKQANLGFFPVQQGGGIGQGNNKVFLGWAETGLQLTVDGTDLGSLALRSQPNRWTDVNYFMKRAYLEFADVERITNSIPGVGQVSIWGATADWPLCVMNRAKDSWVLVVTNTGDVQAARDLIANRNLLVQNGYFTQDVQARRTQILVPHGEGDPRIELIRQGAWGRTCRLDANAALIWENTAGATSAYLDNGGGMYASSFNQTSDERLKESWDALGEDWLAKLALTKVGTYCLKATGQRRIGVSAQSLQESTPVAVSADLDGMLSIDAVGTAIAASVRLAAKVCELEHRLAQLEAGLAV
ncbi:tail fiber domain-containing protein [Janthinobacterium sp. RT4P48]|uniref:tail fiber domain-containing protein n=1 Tax=Janthinobacterium sp. RT4P48 TaxID=3424188 RepID=UPI003F1ECF6D